MIRWWTAIALLVGLVACWGREAHIVEGVVVAVNSPTEVVVDHEDIPNFMKAMTMPFRLASADVAPDLSPGDRLVARMVKQDGRWVLDKVRVTGSGPLPKVADDGIAPVRPGELLPALSVPVTGGQTWTVGAGQSKPTAVAFLYTTCPLPEYCPLVVTRLQGLQDAVGTDARLLAITIDPAHDTLEVLETFAASAGARADTWRFGRLEGDPFLELIGRASLPRLEEEDEVIHGLRLLVLDAEGRLVERYDDNRWPEDRVATQLRTGAPKAPPGSDGTLTRPVGGAE